MKCLLCDVVLYAWQLVVAAGDIVGDLDFDGTAVSCTGTGCGAEVLCGTATMSGLHKLRKAVLQSNWIASAWCDAVLVRLC